MKRSIERILTTHTGSLPRTAKVVELLLAEDKNFGARRAELQAAVRDAVARVVHKQVECGIDVINDGEQGRTDYTVHVLKRLTGYEGESAAPMGTGEPEFPELAEILKHFASPFQHRPACSGPVAWKDWAAAEADIALAKAALAGVKAEDIFMTSPSPGQIARYLKNRYYKSDEDYIYALADVMRREYTAIVEAGFILQLDCPGPGDAAPHGLPQFAARRLPQDHCRQRRRA
jgi:5-methyltetrahydropteroyltriglutamate--homocysteine methyltransferase